MSYDAKKAAYQEVTILGRPALFAECRIDNSTVPKGLTKKERMERLIASIDDILKGENKMDFTIFTKTEVEEMFQTMLEHMPENMRNIAIKEFGSEKRKELLAEKLRRKRYFFPIC